MKNKYSIQQLDELVKQFKKQVMPSIFDKRNDIFNQLQILQQENCLFSRSIYLLIYHLFIDETGKTMAHDDFTIDILNIDFEKISNESCLGSFESQVFLNALKQLNNNTHLFASALITAKTENKSFPYKLFSFSTFPSIFSYFTSSELFSQASQLLLDLLSLNAPDELLNPMILSFFLSMYPFIDAFWNNFYLHLSNRSTIKDDDIMESFTQSMSECASLISTPAYLVLRELLLNRQTLLKDIIIKSFFPITFQLWNMHSNYAMSFEFGSEILNFLTKNADTQKGSMLSSLFVIDSSRIETIPSFTSQCRFSSEVLFFSNIDMKLFVEAFAPISSQIQLFDTLQEASKKCEEYPPFMPFPISFFMSSSKTINSTPLIFNYPKVKVLKKSEDLTEDSIFYTDKINEDDKDFFYIEEPENDSVFEIVRQENQQNKKVQNSSIYKSEEFQIYSLTKDLLNLVEIAETQEFCINLKIQLELAQDYQRSILNLRRFSFSAYISRYIKENSIDQNKENIEAKTFSIIENCTEKRLIIPTFIEVSNYSQFSNFDIPESMHKSFLTIIRSFIETSWKQTGKMSTNKFILNLVPLLSRRKKLHIGNYFYLLDQLLTDLRKICNYFYKKPIIEDEIIILLQAIIYSSNTDVVLDIFLFYEKIAFRCPNFLSNLTLEQSKNWNIFIQIMWKSLEKDKGLFQQVMDMDLMRNTAPKKRKSIISLRLGNNIV